MLDLLYTSTEGGEMNTTLTLTGITAQHSACNCCGRNLGRVFRLSDGNDYGRTCAAKKTGYKVTDQAVRIAARRAQIKAERQAANWNAETFINYAYSEFIVSDAGSVEWYTGTEVVRTPVREWAEIQNADLWA